MITVIAYGLLAAVSSAVRGAAALRLNRPALPYGTLLVNVSGSFLLGLLHGAAPTHVTVYGVGALGSLTTFSTFTHETVVLAEQRRWLRAGTYVVLSCALGVGAAWLGVELAT